MMNAREAEVALFDLNRSNREMNTEMYEFEKGRLEAEFKNFLVKKYASDIPLALHSHLWEQSLASFSSYYATEERYAAEAKSVERILKVIRKGA